MLRVGVTGGIGSGKSLVCSIIEAMGYPVYHADKEAKFIINTNLKAISVYKKLFGNDIYINGKLNSKKVASVIFESPELLRQVNEVIHPLVFEHFARWCEKHSQHSVVFKEAAIIFESGANKHLDKVIGVFAPLEQRVKWVTTRDGVGTDAVKHRMANQMNEEDLKALCDFRIYNSAETLLLPQVLEVVGVLG